MDRSKVNAYNLHRESVAIAKRKVAGLVDYIYTSILQGSNLASLKRIGPFALEASTIRPLWFISILPLFANLLAAFGVGSISLRQDSANPTVFATSLGQILAPLFCSLKRARSAPSSMKSTWVSPVLRQAREQYFTLSQSRSHLLRH